MSAWTPGPWQVAKRKARRVTNHHGLTICNAVLRNAGGPKAKSNMKDEHEAEANACLIAVAPELLEALEGDLDWLDALSQMTVERDAAMARINAHRALIARARGEPA